MSWLFDGAGVLIRCDLDGFHRLPVERLVSAAGSAAEELKGLVHYTCPSLAHFVALLCRPTVACIAPGTSLIVVDSLSALINHAFPKTLEPRAGATAKGASKGVFGDFLGWVSILS